MHHELHANVVAEGGLDHLKQLQRTLSAAGIESQITSPPAKSCGS